MWSRRGHRKIAVYRVHKEERPLSLSWALKQWLQRFSLSQNELNQVRSLVKRLKESVLGIPLIQDDQNHKVQRCTIEAVGSLADNSFALHSDSEVINVDLSLCVQLSSDRKRSTSSLSKSSDHSKLDAICDRISRHIQVLCGHKTDLKAVSESLCRINDLRSNLLKCINKDMKSSDLPKDVELNGLHFDEHSKPYLSLICSMSESESISTVKVRLFVLFTRDKCKPLINVVTSQMDDSESITTDMNESMLDDLFNNHNKASHSSSKADLIQSGLPILDLSNSEHRDSNAYSMLLYLSGNLFNNQLLPWMKNFEHWQEQLPRMSMKQLQNLVLQKEPSMLIDEWKALKQHVIGVHNHLVFLSEQRLKKDLECWVNVCIVNPNLKRAYVLLQSWYKKCLIRLFAGDGHQYAPMKESSSRTTHNKTSVINGWRDGSQSRTIWIRQFLILMHRSSMVDEFDSPLIVAAKFFELLSVEQFGTMATQPPLSPLFTQEQRLVLEEKSNEEEGGEMDESKRRKRTDEKSVKGGFRAKRRRDHDREQTDLISGDILQRWLKKEIQGVSMPLSAALVSQSDEGLPKFVFGKHKQSRNTRKVVDFTQPLLEDDEEEEDDEDMEDWLGQGQKKESEQDDVDMDDEGVHSDDDDREGGKEDESLESSETDDDDEDSVGSDFIENGLFIKLLKLLEIPVIFVSNDEPFVNYTMDMSNQEYWHLIREANKASHILNTLLSEVPLMPDPQTLGGIGKNLLDLRPFDIVSPALITLFNSCMKRVFDCPLSPSLSHHHRSTKMEVCNPSPFLSFYDGYFKVKLSVPESKNHSLFGTRSMISLQRLESVIRRSCEDRIDYFGFYTRMDPQLNVIDVLIGMKFNSVMMGRDFILGKRVHSLDSAELTVKEEESINPIQLMNNDLEGNLSGFWGQSNTQFRRFENGSIHSVVLINTLKQRIIAECERLDWKGSNLFECNSNKGSKVSWKSRVNRFAPLDCLITYALIRHSYSDSDSSHSSKMMRSSLLNLRSLSLMIQNEWCELEIAHNQRQFDTYSAMSRAGKKLENLINSICRLNKSMPKFERMTILVPTTMHHTRLAPQSDRSGSSTRGFSKRVHNSCSLMDNCKWPLQSVLHFQNSERWPKNSDKKGEAVRKLKTAVLIQLGRLLTSGEDARTHHNNHTNNDNEETREGTMIKKKRDRSWMSKLPLSKQRELAAKRKSRRFQAVTDRYQIQQRVDRKNRSLNRNRRERLTMLVGRNSGLRCVFSEGFLDVCTKDGFWFRCQIVLSEHHTDPLQSKYLRLSERLRLNQAVQRCLSMNLSLAATHRTAIESNPVGIVSSESSTLGSSSSSSGNNTPLYLRSVFLIREWMSRNLFAVNCANIRDEVLSILVCDLILNEECGGIDFGSLPRSPQCVLLRWLTILSCFDWSNDVYIADLKLKPATHDRTLKASGTDALSLAVASDASDVSAGIGHGSLPLAFRMQILQKAVESLRERKLRRKNQIKNPSRKNRGRNRWRKQRKLDTASPLNEALLGLHPMGLASQSGDNSDDDYAGCNDTYNMFIVVPNLSVVKSKMIGIDGEELNTTMSVFTEHLPNEKELSRIIQYALASKIHLEKCLMKGTMFDCVEWRRLYKPPLKHEFDFLLHIHPEFVMVDSSSEAPSFGTNESLKNKDSIMDDDTKIENAARLRRKQMLLKHRIAKLMKEDTVKMDSEHGGGIVGINDDNHEDDPDSEGKRRERERLEMHEKPKEYCMDHSLPIVGIDLIRRFIQEASPLLGRDVLFNWDDCRGSFIACRWKNGSVPPHCDRVYSALWELGKSLISHIEEL